MDDKYLLKHIREQKDVLDEICRCGIETNRKGNLRINLRDEEGKLLSGGRITIKQKSHEFKFGVNVFKYGCFDNDTDNAKYEELISGLFNMGTAAIYWDAFEPSDGEMRFSSDSRFIDRRPPLDPVYEFLKKNNMAMKLHPLLWPVFVPEWLPNDSGEVEKLLYRRASAIAERYDGLLECIDVVNEVTTVPLYGHETYIGDTNYRAFKPMREDYAERAFRMADRLFPNTRLVANEPGMVWRNCSLKSNHHFNLYLENLILKGARVDEIGMQYHQFFNDNTYIGRTDSMVNPLDLLDVLDRMSKFNRPISISEISLIGRDEDVQTEMVQTLYKLWFSARNVSSIIYWNAGDNCSIRSDMVPGRRAGSWAEDKYKSGLFRDDFSKKPAYDALYDMIHKEWVTNEVKETADSFAYFRAFYGDYTVEAICDGKKVEKDIHFSRNGFKEFNIVIK